MTYIVAELKTHVEVNCNCTYAAYYGPSVLKNNLTSHARNVVDKNLFCSLQTNEKCRNSQNAKSNIHKLQICTTVGCWTRVKVISET